VKKGRRRKRKTPYRHMVRSHTRRSPKGKLIHVKKYYRGKGKPRRIPITPLQKKRLIKIHRKRTFTDKNGKVRPITTPQKRNLKLSNHVEMKMEHYIGGDHPLMSFSIYQNGKYAGYVLVSPYGREALRIEQLYIEPKYRGMGIGSSAVHRFETLARKSGFKRIVIEDESGSRFWNKLGYKGNHFKTKYL